MSKPNPAKPRKQSTADGGISKGVWYMLEPASLAVHLIGKTEPEIGKWTISLATSLAKGQRGVNQFADELIDERDRFIQERQRCGKLRGKGGRSPEVTSDEGRPYPTRHNTTPPDPTSPRGGAALTQGIETPTLDSSLAIGTEEGYPPEQVRECFEHYQRSGWKDREGKHLHNWRSTLSSWIIREGKTSKPKKPEPKPAASDREFRSSISPRIIGSDQ